MNTRRPRHLREALDTALDFLAGDHHEVSHLVDHDDDVRDMLQRQDFGLMDGLAALIIAGLHLAGELVALLAIARSFLIETGQVAHARLGHELIAAFHLTHRPLQRVHRLFGVRDDRRQKVWDALIDRKLQHFRVDHDEPALFGRQAVDQRQDHRIHPDRLTGAGRPRDEEVGHLGEVHHGWRTANILAQRHGQRRFVVGIGFRRKKRAQIDGLALIIRQFDTDRVLARNDGNACRHCAHRAGDIISQGNDAGRLHTGRRFQFEQGDDRAGPDFLDAPAHTEFAQHLCQTVRLGQKAVFIDGTAASGRRAQKVERG